MNKEEKEAIKLLKQEPDFSPSYYKREKATDIVLNLIDKLQKDNKELNLENQTLYESINCNDDNMLARRYYKLQKENEELKGIKNGTTIEYIGKATYWRKDKIEKYFISKDIIRDKIKEYNKQREKAETKEINDMFVNYIDVLEELLGE